MPTGKHWHKRLRERRIFMQHAAGLPTEEVARNVGMNPKSVRRLLNRVGVDVAQEVVTRRKEQRQ